MTRSRTSYVDQGRAAGRVVVPGALDVTTPVAGFYRFKLRSGGVAVGVRLWFGPPKDPVTGEEMDRSWRWQAEAGGEYVDFDRVWPACGGTPIDEAEYCRLIRQQEWARQNAPDSAYADPRRNVDLLSTNTPLGF